MKRLQFIYYLPQFYALAKWGQPGNRQAAAGCVGAISDSQPALKFYDIGNDFRSPDDEPSPCTRIPEYPSRGI